MEHISTKPLLFRNLETGQTTTVVTVGAQYEPVEESEALRAFLALKQTRKYFVHAGFHPDGRLRFKYRPGKNKEINLSYNLMLTFIGDELIDAQITNPKHMLMETMGGQL